MREEIQPASKARFVTGTLLLIMSLLVVFLLYTKLDRGKLGVASLGKTDSTPTTPSNSTSMLSAPVSPPTTSSSGDTPKKEIKNENGWRIKYPSNWEAYVVSLGNEPLEKGDDIHITGPARCKEVRRCGTLYMKFVYPSGNRATMTAEEYNKDKVHIQTGATILSEVETRVAGYDAYQTTYIGWLSSRRLARRFIHIQAGPRIFEILYDEQSTDGSEVADPKDWKYKKELNEMLDSLEFR